MLPVAVRSDAPDGTATEETLRLSIACDVSLGNHWPASAAMPPRRHKRVDGLLFQQQHATSGGEIFSQLSCFPFPIFLASSFSVDRMIFSFFTTSALFRYRRQQSTENGRKNTDRTKPGAKNLRHQLLELNWDKAFAPPRFVFSFFLPSFFSIFVFVFFFFLFQPMTGLRKRTIFSRPPSITSGRTNCTA